ncbi:MAG: YihY/virulence factor BrkB family protein, partial [Chloroflexi bacterium]
MFLPPMGWQKLKTPPEGIRLAPLARMFRAFRIPISWAELGKRTVNETIEDDVMGLAAQLAYYFFLALFPALLFLVALASFFPIENLMPRIMEALARFAPGDVLRIVQEQLTEIARGQNPGLLTVGFIGTLWSTSTAMNGIIGTLNRAYEITDSRPWWKVRLVAIALTIGVGLFVLISFTLVIAGPALAEPVANWLGLGGAFATTWKIVQWPIVFILVTTAIGLIYYFGPDAEQSWEWITPGSLLATILWVVASLGFRFYVTNFGAYNETYGAIGGVIVALLWLWISAMAILIGAEANAEIENAAPYGKEKGEKRPGEKKKLGRLAAEAWEQAHPSGEGQATPAPGRTFLPAPVPSAVPATAMAMSSAATDD